MNIGLKFPGRQFWATAEAYNAECAALGPSIRTANALPLPGSKCMLCYDATKTVATSKTCPQCARPTENKKGYKCPCGAVIHIRSAKPAHITHWIKIDRMEINFNLADHQASTILDALKAFGAVDATVRKGDGWETITLDNPGTEKILPFIEALEGKPGAKAMAIFDGWLQAGAKLTLTRAMIQRGCGYRVNGGLYAVGNPQQPVPIQPPIVYLGEHSRGILMYKSPIADEIEKMLANPSYRFPIK